MNSDLLRLGFTVGLFTLAGLLIGHVVAGLAVGLAVCLVRQHRMLQSIRRFLRNEGQQRPTDAPGIVNEIIRGINFQRHSHKQREEELTGLLSRLQDTTEALPDAIVILDADHHIKLANKKAAEYLGIEFPGDRGQLVSHLVRQPDLLNYLAGAENGDADKSLIIPSPVNADVSLEIRLIRYAGPSLLLIVRNITEIQRANLMRKDFIANASHELRTPLTVITGYLEAFESEIRTLAPAWGPRLQQMRSQARRMQNLIDDLLKLSSLESGPAAGVDNEVDMEALLSMINDEARMLSGERGHVISLEVAPGLRLKGDEANLYSAISNIVFNAVQYTPVGGGIEIRWRQVDGKACLDVIDTGEGIPAEHLERVTERFYRIDKGRSREKGGTGLGLAIAKHVMVQHDAELKITSRPGVGTEVSCLFPARRTLC